MAGSYKAQAATARPRHETRERRMECNQCNLSPKARARARVIGNSSKQTKHGQTKHTKHTFRSVLKTKKRDTLAMPSVDWPADPFRDLPNPSRTWPHQISTYITLTRPTPPMPPFGRPTRNCVRKFNVGSPAPCRAIKNAKSYPRICRTLHRGLTDWQTEEGPVLRVTTAGSKRRRRRELRVRLSDPRCCGPDVVIVAP